MRLGVSLQDRDGEILRKKKHGNLKINETGPNNKLRTLEANDSLVDVSRVSLWCPQLRIY